MDCKCKARVVKRNSWLNLITYFFNNPYAGGNYYKTVEDITLQCSILFLNSKERSVSCVNDN